MPISSRLMIRFATLAAVLAFAGCSGTGSRVMPPQTASQAAVQASGAALTRGTLTLDLSHLPSSVDRSGKLIPSNATTLTIYVIQAPSGAGQVQYFPVATCVTLPAPGSGTTTVPFAAQVGNDFVVMGLSTGPCAAASALPSNIVSAVQSGIAAGTYSLPATGPVTAATLASVPVIGTAGTGTQLSQVNAGIVNPFVVNPGAGPALGAVTFGFSLAIPQSLVGASLSTSANVTAFEMDAAGIYALPFTIGFAGPPPNGTVPASTSFDFPVTIRVKDTSANAAGNATAGVLKIAGVTSAGATFTGTTPAGAIVAGAPIATALGAPGCTAKQACATMTLNSTPPSGAQFVILYTGANQDTFSSASVTLTYNNQTLASFPVTSQSQVVVLAQQGGNAVLPPGNPSLGVNPLGPLGITEAGDPSAGGSVYVADGPNVWWSGGVNATPFGTNQITFNAADPAAAGSVLGAIADGGTYGAGTVFVGDSACIGCNNTTTGLWSRANNAAGLTQFTTPAGQSMFQATVAPPFPIGPIGIAFWTVGAGAPGAAGTLFVAANNSIYQVNLASAATATSVSLLAGTGIAGVLGGGSIDGPGIAAKLNFGTSKFAGMALDYDPNAGVTAPKNLYVVDTGNGSIRAISLTSPNIVSTLASAPNATGLAYNTGNGLLYVTNSNHTVASLNPTTGTTTGFAGQVNVASTTAGLALAAYPVQFNQNNAVSAAGGGIAAQFGVLGLTANSNAAAQLAAGTANFVARFSAPTGIVYDSNKGYFYTVDNTSAAIRTLQ